MVEIERKKTRSILHGLTWTPKLPILSVFLSVVISRAHISQLGQISVVLNVQKKNCTDGLIRTIAIDIEFSWLDFTGKKIAYGQWYKHTHTYTHAHARRWWEIFSLRSASKQNENISTNSCENITFSITLHNMLRKWFGSTVPKPNVTVIQDLWTSNEYACIHIFFKLQSHS